MSKKLFLIPAVLCVSYAEAAIAAPVCKAAFQNNSVGEKEAVIKCSHDGGAKPSYMCSFTWEMENANGGKTTLSGNFTVNRNDKDAEKYAESRAGGEKIKQEVCK